MIRVHLSLLQALKVPFPSTRENESPFPLGLFTPATEAFSPSFGQTKLIIFAPLLQLTLLSRLLFPHIFTSLASHQMALPPNPCLSPYLHSLHSVPYYTTGWFILWSNVKQFILHDYFYFAPISIQGPSDVLCHSASSRNPGRTGCPHWCLAQLQRCRPWGRFPSGTGSIPGTPASTPGFRSQGLT